MRITTMMKYNTAVNSLNNTSSLIRKYENQLFSGKKVTKASDEPISMTSILNSRREIGNLEQYSRNISTVKSVIQTAEGTLLQLQDILSRCRDLTVQGTNGSYDLQSREAIAQEIQELKDQAGLLANTKFGEYYLFGGVDVNTPPYNRETQQWQANPNANRPLNIEISQNTFVDINMNGEAIFNGAGVANNMFDILDNICNDLLAGDSVSLNQNRLPDIDAALNQLTNSISKIGSTVNRIDIVESKNKDFELNAKEDLSNKEDADIEEVFIALTTARTVYNAGLSVTSKILQTSLVDFLR